MLKCALVNMPVNYIIPEIQNKDQQNYFYYGNLRGKKVFSLEE